MTTVVVVVGAGLAGLCAALSARAAGAERVLLLEQSERVGGNSAKATSGMNAAGSYAQIARSVTDSPQAFTEDTVHSAIATAAQTESSVAGDGGAESGAPGADRALIEVLTEGSAEAMDWLRREAHCELTDIAQCGGHSAPRTHRFPPKNKDGTTAPPPVGFTLIRVLERLAIERGVEVRCGVRVTDLLMMDKVEQLRRAESLDEGMSAAGDDVRDFGGHRSVGTLESPLQVNGVHVQVVGGQTGETKQEQKGDEPEPTTTEEIFADAVVLTTGGFAFDRSATSFLAKFRADLRDLPTSSGPQARGEGIHIAMKAGASIVDMDQIQVHPTGFVNPQDADNLTKFLAPEALRGCGGILITQEGHRFVNELGRRDYVTDHIMQHCSDYATPLSNGKAQKVALLLMSEAMRTQFGAPTLDFYQKRGFVEEYASLEEVPVTDTAALLAAIETYNAAAAPDNTDVTDPFGKTVFPNAPFGPVGGKVYVMRITPVIHYTMGGLRFNSSAEVLQTVDKPLEGHLTCLPGLFAAGEVTGGLHGRNRLAGNSLLECVVFGRIAGRRAAQINDCLRPAITPDNWTPLRLRHRRAVGGGNIFEYSFELPSSLHRLGFPVGHALMVRAILQGEEVVRYYSPISRDTALGHVDLLVKANPDHGAMGRHLFFLKPGDTLDFKGPVAGFDFEVPHRAPPHGDQPRRIGMIAGGVGISPMLQILRQLLTHGPHMEVTLLWGGNAMDELPHVRKVLAWAKANSNLSVTLFGPDSQTPEAADAGVAVVPGFIDAAGISQYMLPPGPDLKIVVCGPYKMCQAMKQALPEAGYPESMWFSYM